MKQFWSSTAQQCHREARRGRAVLEKCSVRQQSRTHWGNVEDTVKDYSRFQNFWEKVN